MPGHPAVRVGLHEGVGQVAERKDGVVDAVRGEVPEHPLDHGNPDDGEHLLGGRERQGAKPRPLAPNEDDCLHYLVVVVDEGFVVVVAGGFVVVVAGALVVVVTPAAWSWSHSRRWSWSPAAVVVVVTGACTAGQHLLQGENGRRGRLGQGRALGHEPGRDQLAVGELEIGGLAASWRPRSPPPRGSCRSWSRSPRNAPARRRPCRHPACRSAHFWPLVYCRGRAVVDGYLSSVLVNVNPVYPSANFPSVALLPASLDGLRRDEEDAAAGGRESRGGARARPGAPAPWSRRCRRPGRRATTSRWPARRPSGTLL